MANDDLLKQKYLQLKTMQEHMEKLSQHIEHFGEQAENIESSIQSIKDLKEMKIESDMLAPIANGVFVKAKLLESDSFLVNVGAGATVEKSGSEVVALLEKQQKSILDKMMDAQKLLGSINDDAMKIYQEMETISEEK